MLNDSQNNDGPKDQIVDIDEVAVAGGYTFCKENGIELPCLLATIWATILSRFTDSQEVHFGLFDDGPRAEEHRKWVWDNNKTKLMYERSCMQMVTVLMRDDMTINRMLCPVPGLSTALAPKRADLSTRDLLVEKPGVSRHCQ